MLYLQDFASYLKDSFVSELCDLDRDLMLSIDILPVPTDEAARQLQNTLLGVETNAANWQRGKRLFIWNTARPSRICGSWWRSRAAWITCAG